MYKNLKFYNGLIVFAVVLVLMVTLAFPAQLFLGIYGLALTELMLITTALIAAKILKADFKAVFPLRLPPVRSFFASLFLYAGIYISVMLVLVTTEYFFPSITEVGDALTDIGKSASPAVSVFIMAFLPAVCEETLHRGLILSSFKHIKSTAVIVVCSAAIFGIFHLDPYRFLSTALLGGAFAYMALKTDSMVLPMIFHFVTNMISVYAIYMTDPSAASSSLSEIYMPATLGGIWLFYLGAALPFIYAGVRLFNPVLGGDLNLKRKKAVLTAAVVSLSILLFIAGVIVITAFGSTGDIGSLASQV